MASKKGSAVAALFGDADEDEPKSKRPATDDDEEELDEDMDDAEAMDAAEEVLAAIKADDASALVEAMARLRAAG